MEHMGCSWGGLTSSTESRGDMWGLIWSLSIPSPPVLVTPCPCSILLLVCLNVTVSWGPDSMSLSLGPSSIPGWWICSMSSSVGSSSMLVCWLCSMLVVEKSDSPTVGDLTRGRGRRGRGCEGGGGREDVIYMKL